MLFNSYPFIFVFLPVVVIGFHLLKAYKANAAITWLIACSLVFYSLWEPKYLILLLGSITANYSLGLLIKRSEALGRSLFSTGVLLNIGLLAYFKYAHFIVDNINWMSGTDFHFDAIVLPLAISFFTFQQIAYLLDVYRGSINKHSFMDYCLFVCFFPQLIAGPIVHFNEIIPQFKQHCRADERSKKLLLGLLLFIIGLFKKTVIADSLGDLVDPIYLDASKGIAIATSQAWFSTFSYALQVYFDFSAYSDMAIGLGLMFGIHLPFNFNSPYKARNFFEYWQRWHMTLTRFMRTHVYLPLARSRKIPVNHIGALMISVVIGGLWHGAEWTMVLWGLVHSAFLLLNHGWHVLKRQFSKKTAAIDSALYIAASIAFTFFIGMLARVLFRSENSESATVLFQAMMGMSTSSYAAEISGLSLLAVSLLLLACWLLPNSQQLLGRYKTGLDPFEKRGRASRTARSAETNLKPFYTVRPTATWSIVIAIAFTLGVMGIARTQAFIYFQF